MPGAHQVAAGVLAYAHEITCSLHPRLGNAHRHQFAKTQELGKPLRVGPNDQS